MKDTDKVLTKYGCRMAPRAEAADLVCLESALLKLAKVMHCVFVEFNTIQNLGVRSGPQCNIESLPPSGRNGRDTGRSIPGIVGRGRRRRAPGRSRGSGMSGRHHVRRGPSARTAARRRDSKAVGPAPSSQGPAAASGTASRSRGFAAPRGGFQSYRVF